MTGFVFTDSSLPLRGRLSRRLENTVRGLRLRPPAASTDRDRAETSILEASSSPMICSVLRVPPQGLPAQPHGDVAQVADRDRPVGDLDRRGGRAPRDHAVDEVAEVVVALVEVDLVGADLRVEDRLRVGRELAAINVDRPLGSLEGHAHLVLVRDDHRHAVLVDRLERVLGRGVPERVGREHALDVADLDRAGHLGAHAPLGAVGMMAAPVGDLAAGVVVDPAEVDVAPGGGIRSVGRGAEPGVVLEARREPAPASCGRRTWRSRCGRRAGPRGPSSDRRSGHCGPARRRGGSGGPTAAGCRSGRRRGTCSPRSSSRGPRRSSATGASGSRCPSWPCRPRAPGSRASGPGCRPRRRRCRCGPGSRGSPRRRRSRDTCPRACAWRSASRPASWRARGRRPCLPSSPRSRG